MIRIMIIPIPYSVPLFYQISDISTVAWKQNGCGVTDVAMIIDFYKPNTTTVQEVLEQGIKSGAYQKNVGWKHEGLAQLATAHGLIGKTFSYTHLDKSSAFEELRDVVAEGPVIASIYRGFNPNNSHGHLIVVTGLDDTYVYYNDPGKKDGKKKIKIADFKNGWKKNIIVIRPQNPNA